MGQNGPDTTLKDHAVPIVLKMLEIFVLTAPNCTVEIAWGKLRDAGGSLGLRGKDSSWVFLLKSNDIVSLSTLKPHDAS